MLGASHVVAVHLDSNGNVIAVQFAAFSESLVRNFPLWILERVAILKMMNNGATCTAIKGYRVNDLFYLLGLDKKETKEFSKLLGAHHGTDARKEGKAKSSKSTR